MAGMTGMQTAGLGMQAYGAGMSAVASYNQAKTQKSTLQYEAAVASNNATMANYQAGQAQVIGAQLEQSQRLKTSQTIGSERAQMAANGIDLGMGSASDILTSTTMMGERDVLTVRDNANRQSWAYKVQAQNYTSEANMDTSMSNSIDPTMAGLSSLIGGATGVARSYNSYNNAKNGG